MSSSSSQSSSDDSFVTAPSSPIRTLNGKNLDEIVMSFYSLPPNPTKMPTWRSSYSCDLGDVRTNPCHVALGDAGSSCLDDDFEFDPSGSAFVDEYALERSGDATEEKHHRHYPRKASLPAMAFADELFCDGQVMPLRPPPRFLYANDEDSGAYGSLPATPRSASMSLKTAFSRRSLWNDDFDPFTKALENVKLGKKGKSYQMNSHRWDMSMSPMQDSEPNKDGSLGLEQAHEEWTQVEPIFSPRSQVEPTGPCSIWAPTMANGRPPVLRPNKDQKGPMKLAEPRGVIFARRARMVKMDYDWPNIAEATRNGKEPKGEKKKNKKKKIKKLLSKSYSKIKAIDDHQKEADEAHLEIPKSKNLKKKSIKSLGWAQVQDQPTCEEKDQVAEATKMTLVHYRPKLLLCMGFGAKYAN